MMGERDMSLPMRLTVKAENGKIVIPVPEAWNGRVFEVEVRPSSAAECNSESIDKATGGERIDTTGWKFDRDRIHDR